MAIVKLRFDYEGFNSSCIDGYEALLKKTNINLEEVKLLRHELDVQGYHVDVVSLLNDDEVKFEGSLSDMLIIKTIFEAPDKVKGEEDKLKFIFEKWNFRNIKITMCISGLYPMDCEWKSR